MSCKRVVRNTPTSGQWPDAPGYSQPPDTYYDMQPQSPYTGAYVATCAHCGSHVMTNAGLADNMYDGTVGVCSGIAGVAAARGLGQYIKKKAPGQYTNWIPGVQNERK